MGIFKTLGLDLESNKNEIGSYKYDKGLQVLENLDDYCLNKADTVYHEPPNDIFDITTGIKIGKFEIGGVSLYDFYKHLNFDYRDSILSDKTNKHIFWIRNSETDEIKTYSNYNSNIRVFYDDEKDELFTYDEKGKDNLYLGLLNVKHYYARNYSTLDGFKYIDDTIPIPLTIYKLDIFACNFQELQALGTWSNQNEYNTIGKDLEKFNKVKEELARKKEEEYIKNEAEKAERKKQEKRENSITYKIIQHFIKEDDEKQNINKETSFTEQEKMREANKRKNNTEKEF